MLLIAAIAFVAGLGVVHGARTGAGAAHLLRRWVLRRIGRAWLRLAQLW